MLPPQHELAITLNGLPVLSSHRHGLPSSVYRSRRTVTCRSARLCVSAFTSEPTFVQRMRRLLPHQLSPAADAYAFSRAPTRNFNLLLFARRSCPASRRPHLLEPMGDIVRNQTLHQAPSASTVNSIPFIISRRHASSVRWQRLLPSSLPARPTAPPELTVMKATGTSPTRRRPSSFSQLLSSPPACQRVLPARQPSPAAGPAHRPKQACVNLAPAGRGGYLTPTGWRLRLPYYQAFDPDCNKFADLYRFEFIFLFLSIFQRRIYAFASVRFNLP